MNYHHNLPNSQHCKLLNSNSQHQKRPIQNHKLPNSQHHKLSKSQYHIFPYSKYHSFPLMPNSLSWAHCHHNQLPLYYCHFKYQPVATLMKQACNNWRITDHLQKATFTQTMSKSEQCDTNVYIITKLQLYQTMAGQN